MNELMNLDVMNVFVRTDKQLLQAMADQEEGNRVCQLEQKLLPVTYLRIITFSKKNIEKKLREMCDIISQL